MLEVPGQAIAIDRPRSARVRIELHYRKPNYVSIQLARQLLSFGQAGPWSEIKPYRFRPDAGIVIGLEHQKTGLSRISLFHRNREISAGHHVLLLHGRADHRASQVRLFFLLGAGGFDCSQGYHRYSPPSEACPVKQYYIVIRSFTSVAP